MLLPSAPNPDAILDEMFGPAVAPADIDVATWMERNFYIPETSDHRLRLEPYQKAVLREAYRRDPTTGHFVYSTIVWSDLKKSIKSTIAGAVGLHRAVINPYGSIKIVANDLKQADSREAYFIRRHLELNKPWAGRYLKKATPSGYEIELKNNAKIEAVPVDPKGEAGGNDDLIIYTELWAADSTAALRMWTETTLSPTKFGRSQRWVETYAGFSGASPLLEQLYDAGVRDGQPLDLSYTDADGAHDLADLEVYANPAARMLCLWNTVPRCPWQTPEYYAQEAATLTPSEFDRVHRNKWASATEAFVPIAWWDACQTPLPPMRRDQSLVVALDASVSGDCFAIVGVTRDGGMTQVRFVRIWTPPKNGTIKFGNDADPDDLDTPEGVCRWLARTYPVIEFGYDPYQLADFTQRLGRNGVGWFRPFSQQGERLRADKTLYDNLRDRKVQWDETTEHIMELRQHIQNADARTENEKLRIVKRAEHGKPIDACVTLSMANYEARRLNLD